MRRQWATRTIRSTLPTLEHRGPGQQSKGTQDSTMEDRQGPFTMLLCKKALQILHFSPPPPLHYGILCPEMKPVTEQDLHRPNPRENLGRNKLETPPPR